MTIERVFGQPNKHTFLIYPIKQLLIEELNGGTWVDPFAGFNSPATRTNDLNPQTPAQDHKDSLEWLRVQATASADGVLYDPPYSLHQAVEIYKAFGADKFNPGNMNYWASCKDEIQRITKPGGKVLCFGWSSTSMGKSRGFEMTRVLLGTHGQTPQLSQTCRSAAGIKEV